MGAKNGDDNVEGLDVYKFMFRSTRGTLEGVNRMGEYYGAYYWGFLECSDWLM